MVDMSVQSECIEENTFENAIIMLFLYVNYTLLRACINVCECLENFSMDRKLSVSSSKAKVIRNANIRNYGVDAFNKDKPSIIINASR